MHPFRGKFTKGHLASCEHLSRRGRASQFLPTRYNDGNSPHRSHAPDAARGRSSSPRVGAVMVRTFPAKEDQLTSVMMAEPSPWG
jgi:hypothetical protein